MSLHDFIKDNASINGVSGDVCSDILRDKDFPIKDSDLDQINYIRRKAMFHSHIKDELLEVISSYKNHQNDNYYSNRKSKYPIEIPKQFNIESVLIKAYDDYKVYLFDDTQDYVIVIDLKLSYWRNKITVIRSNQIKMRDFLDVKINPANALQQLRECKFSKVIKPDQETVENVISILSNTN